MLQSVLEKKDLLKSAIALYAMVEKKSVNYETVSQSLNENRYWLIVKELVKISKPIAEAIEKLEGDHTNSAFTYNLIIDSLRKTLICIEQCKLTDDAKNDMTTVCFFIQFLYISFLEDRRTHNFLFITIGQRFETFRSFDPRKLFNKC